LSIDTDLGHIHGAVSFDQAAKAGEIIADAAFRVVQVGEDIFFKLLFRMHLVS
jgi:hypothetical protein